jgi:glyoxylate reductase
LPTTTHLIDKNRLSMMKNTALLINTSRGPVIDEKALVDALKNKIILGAGLDVFEFEPKLAKGLSKLNNVVLTPHIASSRFSARSMMAEIAVKNIISVLETGQPLNNVY